jgi:uncharacterized membrane protein
MATLSAWKLDTPDGAERLVGVLESLQKQRLITIQDAAVVKWEQGKKKPKTEHLADLTGAGALTGGFWGLLFGLIFFVPFLGMAIGAGMGALMGHFAQYGIDEDFINSVRDQVTPGTSALFLLTSDATPDRVFDAVREAGLHPQLITSNLSGEQEAQLRENFAE